MVNFWACIATNHISIFSTNLATIFVGWVRSLLFGFKGFVSFVRLLNYQFRYDAHFFLFAFTKLRASVIFAFLYFRLVHLAFWWLFIARSWSRRHTPPSTTSNPCFFPFSLFTRTFLFKLLLHQTVHLLLYIFINIVFEYKSTDPKAIYIDAFL